MVGAQANHLVNGRFIPGHFMPGRSKFASLMPVELQRTPRAVLDRIMPDKHNKKGVVGIYGSQFDGLVINGYQGADRKNRPPICSIRVGNVEDIAVDSEGNLIDPDAEGPHAFLYKPNCGSSFGQVTDPYGYPSDAASIDAANKTIILGNLTSEYGVGGISVCTVSGGCTKFLTNSSTIYELAGVALAKNGDCWGSGSNSAGTATMVYFKHCSGSGQAATGWKNTYYGGLDIDTQGNIVAVDAFVPQLWIYRGCNPHCHVVAGPFPLRGDTVFGHLNRLGTEWVGGDYQNGNMLDVYKYSTSALTYEYSITSGLSGSNSVEGAAFAPSSKQ